MLGRFLGIRRPLLLKRGHPFRSHVVAGKSLHRLQADSRHADSHMHEFDPYVHIETMRKSYQ